jgi:hypothetical protein
MPTAENVEHTEIAMIYIEELLPEYRMRGEGK